MPISSITNGVHAPTWVGREVFELAAEPGRRRRRRRPRRLLGVVDKVPGRGHLGDQAGAARAAGRRRPHAGWRKSWAEARRRAGRARLDRLRARPRRADHRLRPPGAVVQAAHADAARPRAAQARCCSHPERPVQLVIAGKAHPADDGGKKLIQEMVQFADDPEVRHRIVFLPNYDIAMAQPLYPGCDVWLNNPLRPYEACGTSGMKAALNGGLNLSILDGWWDEWYDGDNGWAIPSADGVDDPDRRDDLEATALYDLIENEVAPRFYDVDADGVPVALAGDGAAHAEVARPEGARHPDGPRLRPPALRARPRSPAARSTPTTHGAAELAAWKKRVRAGWAGVRVEHVESSGVGDAPEVGATLTVRAFVVARRAVARRRRRPGACTARRRRGRAGRHRGRESLALRRDLRGRPAPLRRHRRARPQPARSATRSGSSRATTCWPRPPSSASSRCPPEPTTPTPGQAVWRSTSDATAGRG